MTAARLVARSVGGIETIVAGEILRSGLGSVTHIGRREVRFAPPPAPADMTGLRTPDDVFVVAARIPDIGRGKDALGALRALASGPGCAAALRARAAYGGPERAHGVEVSASFTGKRNFSRYDVEDEVGAALSAALGLPYHSRRQGEPPPPGYSGWRVTLDGETAALMARIAERPLHRRAYKREGVPGTLHPPVAAAMVHLAAPTDGELVVDPFCGAGTLAAEAARPGVRVRGYDLDPRALAAARANTAGMPSVRLERADAARLPLADGSADVVLANPPWGEQVAARGRVAARPGAWWAELRRVLRGRAVVLLPDPAELRTAIGHGLVPVHLRHVSLSGIHPHIAVLGPGRPALRPRHRAGRGA